MQAEEVAAMLRRREEQIGALLQDNAALRQQHSNAMSTFPQLAAQAATILEGLTTGFREQPLTAA
eukprot:12598272-Prorocentrum_lima.AAC.1